MYTKTTGTISSLLRSGGLVLFIRWLHLLVTKAKRIQSTLWAPTWSINAVSTIITALWDSFAFYSTRRLFLFFAGDYSCVPVSKLFFAPVPHLETKVNTFMLHIDFPESNKIPLLILHPTSIQNFTGSRIWKPHNCQTKTHFCLVLDITSGLAQTGRKISMPESFFRVLQNFSHFVNLIPHYQEFMQIVSSLRITFLASHMGIICKILITLVRM